MADKELDARGLNCPLPILRAKRALNDMTTVRPCTSWRRIRVQRRISRYLPGKRVTSCWNRVRSTVSILVCFEEGIEYCRSSSFFTFYGFGPLKKKLNLEAE